jgi:predicted metal-dependent phosphoesterase TrpH
MADCYDLHSHSILSDGALSPTELVQRAKQQGVSALALTDHDSVAGLAEARACATQIELTFINGIELSCQWQNYTLHIVGLGINPEHAELLAATQQLQQTRHIRAEKIAAKLAKKGIPNALDFILPAVGVGMVTRSHFAHFLVEQQHVNTQQQAFDRYLGKGKAAYVATQWAEMGEAIHWINEAGGVAVLAHPLRYKFSSNLLKRLLQAFVDVGGRGIEVVTGRSNPDDIQRVSRFAEQFNLAASVGSDFHAPEQWLELGRLAPLPPTLKPIWQLLN